MPSLSLSLSLSFQIIDHYCPDGLVYDESSTNFAKCSFPFSVNCADRPELQRAQATDLCPRRNGYFPHRDPTVKKKNKEERGPLKNVGIDNRRVI